MRAALHVVADALERVLLVVLGLLGALPRGDVFRQGRELIAFRQFPLLRELSDAGTVDFDLAGGGVQLVGDGIVAEFLQRDDGFADGLPHAHFLEGLVIG